MARAFWGFAKQCENTYLYFNSYSIKLNFDFRLTFIILESQFEEFMQNSKGKNVF